MRHRKPDVYRMWATAMLRAGSQRRPRTAHAIEFEMAAKPMPVRVRGRCARIPAGPCLQQGNSKYDKEIITAGVLNTSPRKCCRLFRRGGRALSKVKKCMEILPDLKKLPGELLSLRRLSLRATASIFVEVERCLVLPAAAAELCAALHDFVKVCLTFLILSTRSAGGKMLGVGIIKAWGHIEPFCLVNRAFRLHSSNTHCFHRLVILTASSVPGFGHWPKTLTTSRSAPSCNFIGMRVRDESASANPDAHASFLHAAWRPLRSSALAPVGGALSCLFRIFLATVLCKPSVTLHSPTSP